MNESPILLNIAYHCDMKTLLDFMLVSKKCYTVVKYIIRTAPTVFIIKYFVDTNGVLPKKIIYNFLRELFTELHQYYLNHPKEDNDGYGNYAGPCSSCLSDTEFICSRIYYNSCCCNEIKYVGIEMIKYISNESEEVKRKIVNSYKIWDTWDVRLDKLSDFAKGFRIKTILNNLYDNYIFKPPKLNYKSMDYLYFGITRPSYLLRYGLRKWNPNRRSNLDRHYPLTTDIIQFLHIKGLPLRNADFKGQYEIEFDEPESIRKIRINTI